MTTTPESQPVGDGATKTPLLSVRTMEDWLQGRRTPPDWTHAYIIGAVSRAAARKARRRGANTANHARSPNHENTK